MKTLFTILLLLVGFKCFGQEAGIMKYQHEKMYTKIICIAYTSFNDKDSLIAHRADTIIKKYEFIQEADYDKSCKCYVLTTASPLVYDGITGSFEHNVKYYYKGIEIYPIEIIKATKIN